MSWAAVAGAAVGVVGGALSSGGKSGAATTTSQNTIDPRIASYLYGGSGGGGLLNNVNNLYAQQLGQGGLNPMQNAGLELQRQTLTDPRYTQGYGQMRNLGGNLLNQGVAGNPFTGSQPAMGGSGSMGLPGFMPGMPSRSQAGGAGGLVSNGSMGIQQAPMGLMGMNLGAASQPIQQQTAAPQAPITMQDLLAQIKQQQPAPAFNPYSGIPSQDEQDRSHG